MKLTAIRDAADRFGVTIRTIRFYEKKGLISTTRGTMDRRVIDDHNIAKLQKIFDAKALGFTVLEIAKILNIPGPKISLALTGEQIEQQIAFLERQLRLIDKRLAALRSIQTSGQEMEASTHDVPVPEVHGAGASGLVEQPEPTSKQTEHSAGLVKWSR